jgi:hypothetical protein
MAGPGWPAAIWASARARHGPATVCGPGGSYRAIRRSGAPCAAAPTVTVAPMLWAKASTGPPACRARLAATAATSSNSRSSR